LSGDIVFWLDSPGEMRGFLMSIRIDVEQALKKPKGYNWSGRRGTAPPSTTASDSAWPVIGGGSRFAAILPGLPESAIAGGASACRRAQQRC
jgi:hypothetical protein